MKTISQKLRQLARRPNLSGWSPNDWDAWVEADGWRRVRLEGFDELTDDEWFLFCNFVAEALETQ